MPPPKRKDNSDKNSKSRAPVGQDSWRSEIGGINLNDDEWKCVVVMIVETKPDQIRYVELFNKAAEEETREAIFALSYDKLIRSVKSIAKSDVDQGICHFASKQLAEVGESAMSIWLLSRLIKFFVHRAKMKNLKNLDGLVGTRSENGGREAQETLKKTGTTIAKSKGGSGDAKTTVKVGTRVRKRGEERKDKVRIDDAPIDGPDLYVVLSGFWDPGLLPELLNAGVPLTAVFKLVGGVPRDLENGDQLREFWSTVETAVKEPAAAESLCRVIFENFCPPEIPDELEEADVDLWKSDAYRRISFLMYDLNDITRQHASYIRNMKLQPGLDETRPENQAREIYDAIMRLVPEECASVPLVLDALVEQVVIGTGDDELREREAAANGRSGSVERESKIDCLNREFDVPEVGRGNTHPGNSDPRLIIHGDTLGARTHHCSMELIATLSRDSEDDSGVDFGIRVLRQSRIAALWRDVPTLTTDRMTMYAFHVEKISNCFEASEDRTSMTHHYLHLLLLDKMMNGEKPQSNLQEREDLERKVSFPSPKGTSRARSASETHSSLLSSACEESTPHFIFRSDSNIDYKKSIQETFECPELFQLVDAREVLGSGFIYVPESPALGKTFGANLNIDDFDSVQLLSADIFSQIFYECSEEYNTVETRYFAPTDSMLVFFGNRLTSDQISQKRYVASIRTPVCLGDFRRFVVEEEKEWIEKEEAARLVRLAEESILLKDPEDPASIVSRYTDADFVLPNSIKGTKMRKQKSRQALVGVTETDVELPLGEKRGESSGKQVRRTAGAGTAKKIKDMESGNNSRKKRNYSIQTNASSHSIKDDLPLTFLGYDVGNYRVQVSGSRSEFLSEDGTKVRVELEEWSYAEPGLRVAISLFGNHLTLHSVASNCETPPIFHFTTWNGIVMGFDPPGVAGSDGAFRASWPSGLLVETRPDVDALIPFYVKQSYLSKGPDCHEILNEIFRVFLSNGTIIVFLDDGSTRLFYSNGTIATCTGFTSPAIQNENNGQVRKSGSYPSSSASRLRYSQTSRATLEGIKPKSKSLERFSKSTLEEAIRDPQSLGGTLRSIVLDPEGRRYELSDGEITRELGEELVRTLSDYEVGEKFIRRSDGTDILMNSDGVLAVCFPDGSRITTGYVVEKELVYCDWTEDELNGFDYPISDEGVSTDSSDEGDNFSTKNLSITDGFVSILLTSCMEHRNYSTVTFDQSKRDCTLSMPGKVNVRISNDDEMISVAVDTAVSLEVHLCSPMVTSEFNLQSFEIQSYYLIHQVGRQDIVLTSQTEATSGTFSKSIYNLEHFSSNSLALTTPLLCTTDSFGNVFKVDSEGNTSYEKLIRGMPDGEKGNRSSSFRLPTSLANLPQPNSRGCRLFVVRRDLTAFEYLHRSVRETQENEAGRDETASVFHLRIPDHPDQDLYTTLTALNPITVSRGWLQPYKVPKIRVTNADRRDLLRSTYSVPWDYLIPYGKKMGIGIRDYKWNEPLKRRANESSIPELVLARTTQRIKIGDRKMVSEKLRNALGCYWKKTINRFNEYRGSVARRSVTSREREIEEWLNDYALGRKKTFDKALYSSGLVKNRPGAKLSAEYRLPRRIISNKITDEEIEWYKNCLKNRIVPPYFANISGACFAWIFECIDRIGNGLPKENEDEEKE